MVERLKLVQSIRSTFGPREMIYTSLDSLVNPEFPLSWGQRKAAKRLLGKDNGSVNAHALWTLKPTYLQPLAYLAFAPTFLLAEGYELLGFGPERCGLRPEKVAFGFGRFPEVIDMVETEQRNWYQTYLLPLCTAEESDVLNQYVEFYIQDESKSRTRIAG